MVGIMLATVLVAGGGNLVRVSGPCDTAMTTLSMQQCLGAQVAVADSGLQRLEDSIAHSLPALAIQKLRTASRLWFRYRDAQCVAVASRNRGGTIAPLAVVGCKITADEEREAFLRRVYAP